MSESENKSLTPNEAQQQLIDGTDGTYLVDAGAGTGKTFTITRRYATIVDQDDIAPADVRLFTFTESAATEMRERIVSHCEYEMAALRDAPIGTFHGLCNQLLNTHGFAAPQHLGISETLSPSAQVISDEVLEAEHFETFVRQFRADHPEYNEFFQILRQPSELLAVIRELAAKGIFPTADGWYRNGGQYLDGDDSAFADALADSNAARNGGSKQSKLRSTLYGWDSAAYEPAAPTEDAVRGSEKEVPEELLWEAFETATSDLQSFIRELYHAYIEFALDRNYITFWMQLLFAFVLLCEDESLRESMQAEYVMIDEFQDTNELQFKIALLFAGTENLCVVGDWKQSIFGFQHAAVENILEFADRLETYIGELNADSERVPFTSPDVTPIELTENYRSTSDILEFSKDCLTLPATGSDDVDSDALPGDVVSLTAAADSGLPSHIEAFSDGHDQGIEGLLTKIQQIVGNDTYAISSEDDGEPRAPRYDDIAVLTRVRGFGREFQREAATHDIPVSFEGGVELFDTDHAKLTLAWLRIVHDEAAQKGWAVALEHAGYTLPEARQILETAEYPQPMRQFQAELRSLTGVGPFVRKVLERYGLADEYGDALIHTLQSTLESTSRTRADLIRFIEHSWANESTVEISDRDGQNTVTVQTIHKAKGLEYPIVIVANMNRGAFPPNGGGDGRIRYSDTLGLQQTHVTTSEYGSPYVVRNWRHALQSAAIPTTYDEERRLLYVAMTRAKQHLLFSAGETPCTFFEELACEPEQIEPAIPPGPGAGETAEAFEPAIQEGTGATRLSAHDIMGPIETAGSEGKGVEFGQQVHDFAEDLVNGASVDPQSRDEEYVAQLIDSLDGQLIAEQQAHLPLETAAGPVLIAGIIDLLHVQPDRVDVIDFKTDRSRDGVTEYQKQLSVYYHVLTAVYPDRDVDLALFFTADGERVPIEPLGSDAVSELARGVLTGHHSSQSEF